MTCALNATLLIADCAHIYWAKSIYDNKKRNYSGRFRLVPSPSGGATVFKVK